MRVRGIVASSLLVLVMGVGPAPAMPSPDQLEFGEDGQPPRRIGNAEMLTLPNLAPLPPYDVWVGTPDHPSGPLWSNLENYGYGEPPGERALRFTTTIQNRGRYSFELVGGPWTPDPDDPDLMMTQAYQCVRFTGPVIKAAQRTCVRYDSVGTMTWHAQHRHFHIDGFGRYELRRERDGRPDLSPGGLLRSAGKVGWCVSDMYNYREDSSGSGPLGTAQDARYSPQGRGWYGECTDPLLYMGASWRQGISPGWTDTYPARYTGQEIPIDGIGDGIYWLVTTINPKDNPYGLTIQETSWADNTSASRIQLYDGGTKARLLWPLPEEPYRSWMHNPHDQPGE